mgnify:CR=1 FL=1|jgi:hypothetical protein
MSTKLRLVRHETNPFLEGMVVPVKGQKVQLSRIGKDDNVLVNHATGEVQGTHVTTYRTVDADQFVKLFSQNIALTFSLKAAGIKAFNVLIWILQSKAIDRDLIPLDKFALEEFVTTHANRSPSIKLSLPTFGRGLVELESAQIIAKHIRPGFYYINPNFCFNGDRIAFTTVIQRKNEAQLLTTESDDE